MLSCKQASQLISQSLDRPLKLNERFELRFHLIICKYCKRFSQQVQALRVALKELVNTIENNNAIEMPASAKNRIADLVEANRPQP
jgi:hypothetical protein